MLTWKGSVGLGEILLALERVCWPWRESVGPGNYMLALKSFGGPCKGPFGSGERESFQPRKYIGVLKHTS